MYGKIFDSMYDGTLADDWRALVTFQQMIVLCDADGTLDMTPKSIARRTGIPIEHIKAGIEILENPDPYSRTDKEEGRRIVRMDDHRPWGWFLVNHSYYKGLTDAEDVRRKNRERKRKQRARAAEEISENTPDYVDQGTDVTECHTMSHDVTPRHEMSQHTDTDTDTDTEITNTSDSIPNPTDVPDESEAEPEPTHKPAKMTKDDHNMVIGLYEQIIVDNTPESIRGVSKSRWLTSKHARELQARWREDENFRTPEFWEVFFQTAFTNDWWMGRPDAKGETWGKANLAWLVKRTNFDKVLELGGYDV